VPSAGTAQQGQPAAPRCRLEGEGRQGGSKEREDSQNLNSGATAEKNPECLDEVCF